MSIDTLAEQAGAVTDPTHDQLLAGRGRLEDATNRAGARVVAVRRHRRSTRRWAVTVLTAAAAVTTLLVVPLSSAPQASAEQVLLRAAQSAGEQPDPAAGAAYWYVRSQGQTAGALGPWEREIWKGRTRNSVIRDESWARSSDGPGVEPKAVLPEVSNEPWRVNLGNERLSWQDVEALPTDPAQLSTLLASKVARRPSEVPDAVWSTVTDLLRESPASPALRRALWEVAAGIPDVTLVGPMTDAAGRRGTAIERDHDARGWGSDLYILDPSTGALLEWRLLGEDGRVSLRSTELEQRPSSTAPNPPPAPCGSGSQPPDPC